MAPVMRPSPSNGLSASSAGDALNGAARSRCRRRVLCSRLSVTLLGALGRSSLQDPLLGYGTLVLGRAHRQPLTTRRCQRVPS